MAEIEDDELVEMDKDSLKALIRSCRQGVNDCPVCGNKLIKESGCTHCIACDYSHCG